MRSFASWSIGFAALVVVVGTAVPAEPYRLRGTVVAVDDRILAIMNDDEETVEVALTDETDRFAVTPAKWTDLQPGQFVGVTSVESGGRRVALGVQIFAEDLRGTNEGDHPWDLVTGANMMTNATIAEIEQVNPAERRLRLTYQEEGEGEGSQGEQIITVPDFADIVFLAKSDDPELVAPDRRSFLLVREATEGPPAVILIAVGLDGALPPM